MIAFGDVASAVMGNDQATVNEILAAAAAAGERMWQLPLFPEYDEKIKSDIADLKNSAGREGSPITAGAFLKAFTKDSRWVHIDIAGREIADRIRPDQPKGATGHGVRTLFEYCRSLSKR
jgi:leucyl aminopeptidase